MTSEERDQPLAKATISLARATAFGAALVFLSSVLGLVIGNRYGESQAELDREARIDALEAQIESLTGGISSRDARISETENLLAKAQARIEELRKAIRNGEQRNAEVELKEGVPIGAGHLYSDKRAVEASIQEQGFKFDLLGCSNGGTSVYCELMITNLQDERWLTISAGYKPASYLVDSNGNSCKGVQSTFRSGSLPKDVPLRVKLEFTGCSRDISSLTYLRLAFGVGSFLSSPREEVSFRNIQLSS